MARNLYALLVGINEYDERSRIPFLKGCINDIHGMQAYLEGRVAHADFDLQLRVLTNEQATRQGIIDGFQQHLSQAKGEDVALFYYAGHGAQAAAPEAFWPVAPSRLLETLVCYDSRIDSEHWDLADKELAQLIAEVDRHQPHIVVVLDCCHSGSGTREAEAPAVAIRQALPDLRPRPLESFIVSPAAAQTLSGIESGAGSDMDAKTVTRSFKANPTSIHLPVGRHVVLSACSNIEQAKEYYSAGQPRGTFSFFLQDALVNASGKLSYRDLFKRTNALVRSSVSAQSPQIEATHSEDLAQPFLGGAITPTMPYFTVSHHKMHGWVIDGGAIHGLQSPTDLSNDLQTTTLALFPSDAQPEQLKTATGQLGTATVTQVLPQLSQIESAVLDGISPGATCKAVVLSLPLPPCQVFLTGDAAGVEHLRQAIATVGPLSAPSWGVGGSARVVGVDFCAIAQADTYRITSPTSDRPLVTPTRGDHSVSAFQVAQTLEHIARWKTIAGLNSPANSQIQGAVELKIYTGSQPSKEAATEITDPQIRLSYRYDSVKQAWSAPRFRIKLHNTSDQTLYCALFYLTERFKAEVIKPDGIASLVRLSPGEDLWFGNGAALNGTVADALWREGITECQDILKLIACTDEFDPMLLVLGELGSPVDTPRSLRSTTSSSLNRLMQKVTTREMGFVNDESQYDDWVANQVTFTFVRPRLSTPLNSSQPISVDGQLRIQPHRSLNANVRLTTVPQSTRDLGHATLPPLLQASTEPFQFTQSRASDPGLSVLELSNLSQRESVTAEQPLRLEVQRPLENDAYLLPIAYDGEFYVPLGYGKTMDGHTQIVIERLTAPITQGDRSVHGSIRIFFQKVMVKKLGNTLSKQLGLSFEYPLLTVAQWETAGQQVSYIHDVEAIKASVADAQTIALYIHGIFGDTASMLPSVKTAAIAIETVSQPIGELYDLVLAFDYENLNTTIEQNARSLKERLAAVGLEAGHSKTLHMIAHSMGGLVSRWFIEREGGHEIVNHLILLGTPNAGSPWPQVQAGMTAAVSMAINGLSLVAAPLKILEGLLQQIETLDVSLDQMQPESDFLQEIANSPDPGIPYTLVIGNTSLVVSDEATGLKQKLMRRLGKIAEMPFFNQPNDIAVLVESITAIPPGWAIAPSQLPVACNHLEYFTHPAGLAALAEAVTGTGIAASMQASESPSETVATAVTESECSEPETVGSKTAEVETAASATSPAVKSSDEPQLPGFKPLPTANATSTIAAPESSPAAASESGTTTLGDLLSKLWVWILMAIVLGGITAWGWAQLTRPVTPPAPSTDPSGTRQHLNKTAVSSR